MKATLSRYEFAPLDWHLARTIAALSHDSSQELELAVALLSKRCREGHVCVSLADTAGQPLSQTELNDGEADLAETWPRLQIWMDRLHGSGAVTRPECLDPTRPLVLAGDHLYLTRYFLHERALIERVRQRAAMPLSVAEPSRIRTVIDTLCSPLGAESAGQRLAIAIALLSRLCVVTGGPGTGKTTAIVRLLSVLIEQALSLGDEIPQVQLLAPTGKAASRISESIRHSKHRLEVSDSVREHIPETAGTIHRALGVVARPDYSGNPRLAADVVIVDEASMVDLALMRRLFDACANVPRLILLGDPEQLESVLAGSVLAELTANPHQGYCKKRAAALRELTGLDVPMGNHNEPSLDDCRIELTISHRFQSGGGIGLLAQAIRSGRGDEAWGVLTSNDTETEFIELPSRSSLSSRIVLELAEQGYRELVLTSEPAAALAALQHFRILCGHRHGPLGVEPVNQMLANATPNLGIVPFLITENAPELSLYNGDVGVLSTVRSRIGRRAYLLGPNGELRAFSPSRLPAHELAFAMTVHKSQGSEVERVVVVLPKVNSPLLTRELLYTAITRARKACTICGTKAAFLQACERKTRRTSGLADGLAMPV